MLLASTKIELFPMPDNHFFIDPVSPILKWAGGKRSILEFIERYLPELNETNTFHEPFLGAGAVFFSRTGKFRISGSDINPELINLYEVVEKSPDALIRKLRTSVHFENSKVRFEETRKWDRHRDWPLNKNQIERAARMLYLNKTCYNGLYRENSAGQFNTPYGYYKNPLIADEKKIKEMSKFLNAKLPGGEKRAAISKMDFSKALEAIPGVFKPGDVVYLDPPYEPISETSSFTAYAGNNRTESEGYSVEKLFELAQRLVVEEKVTVLISNSIAHKVEELALKHNFGKPIPIPVRRNLAAKTASRAPIEEYLFISKPE